MRQRTLRWLRHDRSFLALLLLVHFLLASWLVMSRTYLPRYDSGHYVSAAVAVSQGIGLRDITAPPALPSQVAATIPIWTELPIWGPEQPDWPRFVTYPPLLPILLAPLVLLGAGRLDVLQLLPYLGGLATLLLAYRWRASLFPALWRPTLLLTVLSSLSLYSVRVQSEALLAPFVLWAIHRAIQAEHKPQRWLRSAAAVGGILLLALCIHTKVFFIGLGLATWFLARIAVPTWKRLVAAAVVVVMGAAPGPLWQFFVSWRGHESISGLDPVNNPYFLHNGWEYGGVTALSNALGLSRLVRLGPDLLRCLLFGTFGEHYGTPLDTLSVRWSIPIFLVVAGLLMVGIWRSRGGSTEAAARAVVVYILGVVLSPWLEPRMFVPILPVMLFFVVSGLDGLGGRLLGSRPRVRAGTALVLGTATVLLCARSWIGHTAERDYYAQEYHQRSNFRFVLDRAVLVPEDQVIINDVDYTSLTLLTGRSTVPIQAAEWKNSSLPRYLAAGGRGVLFVHTPEPNPCDEGLLAPFEGISCELGSLQTDGEEIPFYAINQPASAVVPTREATRQRCAACVHPRPLGFRADDAEGLWRSNVSSAQER